MLENKTSIVTVKDMYDYFILNATELEHFLPPASAVDEDFWDVYDGDYEEMIDKYFVRKFKTFWYYDQDTASEYNTTANVYLHFYDDVLNHLKLNCKRYNELYRIVTLQSTDISPINDFHITEEREAHNVTNGTYIAGQRLDSGTNTKGSETDTTTTQKMAFNSSDFINDAKSTFVGGQRQDSYSDTKGAQTDTNVVGQDGTGTIVTSGRKDNAVKNVKEFYKYWSDYTYFDKIFIDISKELLLI